jgi:hypothetical protein
MTHHHNDYRWQPGEREQVEAEMAERAARNKREEVLAWALDRQAARNAPKSYEPPVDGQRRQAAVPEPNTFSQEWANYIAAKVKRSEESTIRACMTAVGEVIGKNVVELEKRCAALEAELAELRDRETTRRLRAVPSSTPGAMIA